MLLSPSTKPSGMSCVGWLYGTTPSQLRSIMAANFSYGREILIAQLFAPRVEEASRIGRVGIIPKLLELLTQQIGDVQAGIGLQKPFEIFACVVAEVLPPRQQHIALAFDEAAILARDALVLRAANDIERIAKMFDHVEPVEQDRGFWRVTLRRNAKRLPHVHHRELDFPAVLLA